MFTGKKAMENPALDPMEKLSHHFLFTKVWSRRISGCNFSSGNKDIVKSQSDNASQNYVVESSDGL